jgi:dTDP-4-amino-4,6-dideoxygalactose transaminase
MVEKALKSSHLTQGKLVQKFEETCAEYLDKTYAVAVSNGTAALYCAYRTYDERTFKNKQILQIPAITFKATLRAAQLTKNNYVVVDTEENGINHSANVKVDLGGYVPDYRSIIEDASHAFGSHGVGNSLMTCFSLHATKNLGVGEGGLIVTDSKEMYEGLKSIREFGTVSHPSLNFRMSEITAALGASRLERVKEDAWLKKECMLRYIKQGIPIIPYLGFIHVNHHLAICEFDDPVKLHWGLKKEGIGSQRHYEPLERGHTNAEHYWSRTLSIPLYPQLTIEEQNKVIITIQKLMKEDKNGKD